LPHLLVGNLSGQSSQGLTDLPGGIGRTVLAACDERVDLRQALAFLARRGVTRIFSEGGPRVGSKLIELGIADEVALFTATKPLGRKGLPALAPAAYRALEDPARYGEAEPESFAPDEMRRWERRE